MIGFTFPSEKEKKTIKKDLDKIYETTTKWALAVRDRECWYCPSTQNVQAVAQKHGCRWAQSPSDGGDEKGSCGCKVSLALSGQSGRGVNSPHLQKVPLSLSFIPTNTGRRGNCLGQDRNPPKGLDSTQLELTQSSKSFLIPSAREENPLIHRASDRVLKRSWPQERSKISSRINATLIPPKIHSNQGPDRANCF